MKILIIKHGALGDFVLAIGMMRRIAERHPGAEITLMTGSMYLPIARQMGIFSDYIIDNRRPYLKGDVLRVLKQTVAARFDYIYDVQGSKRTRRKYFPLLRWMSPHSFVWVNSYWENEVHVQKNRRWSFGRVEQRPIENLDSLTDLSFLHGENAHFGELPERYVLMIPGCSPNHPYKRWPVAYYGKLACWLAERGIASVVIGTQAEAEELEGIAALCPSVVNMMNKTTLLDVPDLALRSLAVVGNDTGPTHMASLAGAPTIAIYDYRTRQGALRGRRSWSLVSEGDIAQIAVERVQERLSGLLDLPAAGVASSD